MILSKASFCEFLLPELYLTNPAHCLLRSAPQLVLQTHPLTCLQAELDQSGEAQDDSAKVTGVISRSHAPCRAVPQEDPVCMGGQKRICARFTLMQNQIMQENLPGNVAENGSSEPLTDAIAKAMTQVHRASSEARP